MKIDNYEYSIYKDGKIKNNKTGRVLKPYLTNNGYQQVTLCNETGKKKFYIHRLVAQAFIPNFGNLEVNHKDGIKTNNSVDNLEWVTRSENNKHAYRIGLKRANKPYGNTYNSQVIHQILDGVIIKVWESATKAAESLGVSTSAILSAEKRGGKSCGFNWKK